LSITLSLLLFSARISPPGCSSALLMKFVEVVIDITGEQAEQDWQVWIDIARKSS
jgi:hypothetical protein